MLRSGINFPRKGNSVINSRMIRLARHHVMVSSKDTNELKKSKQEDQSLTVLASQTDIVSLFQWFLKCLFWLPEQSCPGFKLLRSLILSRGFSCTWYMYLSILTYLYSRIPPSLTLFSNHMPSIFPSCTPCFSLPHASCCFLWFLSAGIFTWSYHSLVIIFPSPTTVLKQNPSLGSKQE